MRCLVMLLLTAGLVALEWELEPGASDQELWAAAAGDDGRAVVAWLGLAIDGDPIAGGVWWPALAEAQRRAAALAAGRAPASLAEAAPGLWVEAVQGRTGLVLEALARWPEAAGSADAVLLRLWCTADWRALAPNPPQPGSFAGVVWLRALLLAGRHDQAVAWQRPGSGWLTAALLQVRGPGQRHALRRDLRDAAVALVADDEARAAHARRRRQLAWHWLITGRPGPVPPEVRALHAEATVAATADGEPWLLAASGLAEPPTAGWADASEAVPEVLLAAAQARLPEAARGEAASGLLTRWRRLRGSGWCAWDPLVEAMRVGGVLLRLDALDARLADDPWLAALAGRHLPWDTRLDRSGIPGLAISARWRDAEVDLDVGQGSWPVLGLSERFAIRWTGRVHAATAGTYAFATTSDDGSVLFIAGEAVVDNRGLHGAQTRRGNTALAAGWHDLDLRYHDYHWGAMCRLQWRPPGANDLSVIPVAALTGPDGAPGLLAEGGPFQGFDLHGPPEPDAEARRAWVAQAPWSVEPRLALMQAEPRQVDRPAHLLQVLSEDPASPFGSWLEAQVSFHRLDLAIRPWAEAAAAADRTGTALWAQRWLAHDAARSGDRDRAEAWAAPLAEAEWLNLAAVPAAIAERLGDWAVAAERHDALAERFAVPTRRLDAALCRLHAGAVPDAVRDLAEARSGGWSRRWEAVEPLRQAGELDLAADFALAERKPERDSTAAALLLEAGRLDAARRPLAQLANSRARDGQPLDDQALVWLGAWVLAQLHGEALPERGMGDDLATAPGLDPELAATFAAIAGGPPPASPWLRALLAVAAGDAAAARAACVEDGQHPRGSAACAALRVWLDHHGDLAALRRRVVAPTTGADLGR